MDLVLFLEYGLPTVMIAVLLTGSVIVVFCQRRIKKMTKDDHQLYKSRAKMGAIIVDSIRTNNSVPCLEKTFEELIENLDARQLKLNIDLRGYTTDAE